MKNTLKIRIDCSQDKEMGEVLKKIEVSRLKQFFKTNLLNISLLDTIVIKPSNGFVFKLLLISKQGKRYTDFFTLQNNGYFSLQFVEAFKCFLRENVENAEQFIKQCEEKENLFEYEKQREFNYKYYIKHVNPDEFGKTI